MQIMQTVQNLSSKQAMSGMAPALSAPQLAQRQRVLTTTRAAKNPLKAPFKGKVCMHYGSHSALKSVVTGALHGKS